VYDLLIIGGGLAGATLAAESYSRGIRFKWVVSKNIPTASFAAYGMCNPVHFHNIVPAWKADVFLEPARNFYLDWQTKTGKHFYNPLSVHHLVVNPLELVQWRQQVESTDLWKYSKGDLTTEFNSFLNSSIIGAVPITTSFFVDIAKYVLSIREILEEHIVYADLMTDELEIKSTNVVWKGESAAKIIFADGSEGSNNSFFSKVSFNLCKGEILVLKIPGLTIDTALHKKIVLLPIGNEHFICGATYEWNDLSSNPSEKGKEELLNTLGEILNDRFSPEVVDHKAGVRPTISDRRPVIGWHPIHPVIGILNGFGTKGLMFAPACVSNLLDNFQNNAPILVDWDVNRFKKRLSKKPS
jgi:glycine oxidase